MKPPIFTRHGDGRTTVDAWTSEIVISREFFETPLDPAFDPAFIRVAGDDVEITVANGKATYRIVEHREHEVVARLVTSEAA